MKSHLVNDHLRRAINVDVVRTHRNDIAPRSIRFGGFESFGDIYKRELNLSFEVCGDFTVFLPATLAGGSDCVAEDYGLREVELSRFVSDAGVVVEGGGGHFADEAVRAMCFEERI